MRYVKHTIILVLLAFVGAGQNFAAHLYSTASANIPRSLHQGLELGIPFLVPLGLALLTRKRSAAFWLVNYGMVFLMIGCASFVYLEQFYLAPDRKRAFLLDVYLRQWLVALAGLVACAALAGLSRFKARHSGRGERPAGCMQ